MAGITLPVWVTKNCSMGVGQQCLVRNELASLHLIKPLKFDPANECVGYHLGVCFQHATTAPTSPLFNFSVFVTALTLMAVVFTITDVKFKFRIAVTPGPFIGLSTLLFLLIGGSVLISDVAFSHQWPVPKPLNDPIYWQAIAGGVFLLLVFTWMLVGFLRPPKYSKFNSLKFARAVYRAILTGNVSEVTAVAQELERSAKRLTNLSSQQAIREKPGRNMRSRALRRKLNRLQSKFWRGLQRVAGEKSVKWLSARTPGAAPEHAWSIFLLMGGRRFCECVVNGAPGTAIAFFQEAAKAKDYDVPLGQFAINVSQEAIRNRQSLLYHENIRWSSDALGHWKPFSAAVYGNYQLVEALAARNGSPLDVGYLDRGEWNADQFEAYTRAVLITFKSYLDAGYWGQHSYCLARSFGTIGEIAGENNWRLEEEADAIGFKSDAERKLWAGVEFVKDAMDAIGKMKELPKPARRTISASNVLAHDIYDDIAVLIYSLIEGASRVRSGKSSWGVQFNSVWSPLMLRNDGKHWEIVKHKVLCLIYEEVAGVWFSYLTARIFGMAVNVVGFRDLMTGESLADKAFRKKLLGWARANLMKVWNDNPDIVKSGLPANLQVEPVSKCVVRTYPNFGSRKPKIIYFPLD